MSATYDPQRAYRLIAEAIADYRRGGVHALIVLDRIEKALMHLVAEVEAAKEELSEEER